MDLDERHTQILKDELAKVEPYVFLVTARLGLFPSHAKVFATYSDAFSYIWKSYESYLFASLDDYERHADTDTEPEPHVSFAEYMENQALEIKYGIDPTKPIYIAHDGNYYFKGISNDVEGLSASHPNNTYAVTRLDCDPKVDPETP